MRQIDDTYEYENEGGPLAVYDMIEEDGEVYEEDGICLSYFRSNSSEYQAIRLYPRRSLSYGSALEDFVEALEIAREILPPHAMPKGDPAVLWEDGYVQDLETVSGKHVFHLFTILRYPAENPHRWRMYNTLWQSGRYTSRYLCYVVSQAWESTMDRNGEENWGNNDYFGKGHSEFDGNGPLNFLSRLKEHLEKVKPTPFRSGWGNIQSDFINFYDADEDEYLSEITTRSDVVESCDLLHQVNDVEFDSEVEVQ